MTGGECRGDSVRGEGVGLRTAAGLGLAGARQLQGREGGECKTLHSVK